MAHEQLDFDPKPVRDYRVAEPTVTRSLESHKRGRGVRVTAGAIGAALSLALGGGVLASGSVAGAATTTPAGSDHAPAGSAPAPGKVGPGQGGRGGLLPGGKPPAAVGTVKSVGSDSFTLSTPNNAPVTVNVTSSTAYKDTGVSSPSISDVKTGEHVAVIGTSDNGTVTASTVLIGEPTSKPGARGLPGIPGSAGGPPKTGTPSNGPAGPTANSQS